MNGSRQRWLYCLAGALLFAACQRAAADDLTKNKSAKGDTIAMPSPAEIKALDVFPPSVALKGIDDSQQLVVSGQLPGRKQDLTGEVKYEVADPGIVRISGSGRILPLANGNTTIKATYGDKTIVVSVSTEACDVNLPINFGTRSCRSSRNWVATAAAATASPAARTASSCRSWASSPKLTTRPW